MRRWKGRWNLGFSGIDGEIDRKGCEVKSKAKPTTETRRHGDTEKIKTNFHHRGHNVAEPQPKPFFTTEDTKEHEENRNQSLPQRSQRKRRGRRAEPKQ